ncbi:MAG: peptidylprolyl isomerase [Bacillota bacterium]|nr:peptidylprolyl isomerase [Bacillota bacterium]
MKNRLVFALILVLCLSFVIAGCTKKGGNKDGVVVTINGEDITTDEFNYYILMAKNTVLSAGGEDTKDYWKTTEIEGKNAGEVVKETALKNAIELTITAQKAIKKGADHSDEVKAQQRQNFIKQGFSGNEKDYLARIKELGLKDEAVSKVVLKDYLTTKLYSMIDLDKPTDAQMREYYDKNYMRAKHILIAFSNYATKTSDGSQQALAKIKEVKAKLDSGEDFDKLLAEYNEDPEMKSNPDGYIFKSDVMPKQFEEATRSLKIGEVSDIVKSDYGYHIIKRFDPSGCYEDFLNKKSSAIQKENSTGRDELTSFVQYSQIEKKVEEWKDQSKIEINENLLKSIELIKK